MINSKFFGKTKQGEDVTLYTIDNGMARVSVMDYGATLVSFEVKDGHVFLRTQDLGSIEEISELN